MLCSFNHRCEKYTLHTRTLYGHSRDEKTHGVGFFAR
jgi:hypothetical protein